jgi:hypothetical protein
MNKLGADLDAYYYLSTTEKQKERNKKLGDYSSSLK